jgi:hypothetical protein
MKKLILLLFILTFFISTVALAETPEDIIFKVNLKKNLLDKYNNCMSQASARCQKCACVANYNEIAQENLDPTDLIHLNIKCDDCNTPPWQRENDNCSKKTESKPVNKNDLPPWMQ